MTISLIAIASVMVLSCLFGVFIDRIFIRWLEGLKAPSEDEDKHSCNRCRYGKVRPQDYPCCECLQDDDIDRWEAIE